MRYVAPRRVTKIDPLIRKEPSAARLTFDPKLGTTENSKKSFRISVLPFSFLPGEGGKSTDASSLS